ncbi:MAG TPA: hypothetical protein VF873_08985 [Gemmatimonadales bacterium]
MHTARSVLLVAPVALLLAACDSTAPRPLQRINLSASATPGIVADLIVSGTGGSVRITSAQLTLSHIKLASDAACTADDDEREHADSNETAAGTNETDADNDEHECEPIRVDPVQVNLPLDGTTKVVLDALVPAGSYLGLRAKLERVNVVGVFTDAGGTDHAFTFTSDAHAEVSVDFATPITVNAGTSNLTIDVDVGSWFKGASGAILDPNNAENQEAVEHAIRASFHAFEDDNHDGDDDHEEEGGH